MNRTLKYVRKFEGLEDRNEELELKMKKYEDLFSDVTVSILNYVSKVHNDIQEVSDEYKGIINFDDEEMLNKVKEIQEKREEGLKEETEQDIIKRKKQENMDLLRDLSHRELEMKEIEIENEKYLEKDKNLRGSIQELNISFASTQHRFESRINEYKQQLHLKNEFINNLKDQVQFQKRVISDQDQNMAIAENKEGINGELIYLDSQNAKLKDSKEYQELQNKKLREYGTMTDNLTQQIKDLFSERDQ